MEKKHNLHSKDPLQSPPMDRQCNFREISRKKIHKVMSTIITRSTPLFNLLSNKKKLYINGCFVYTIILIPFVVWRKGFIVLYILVKIPWKIDNNRWNFVKMKCAPGKICISVCILLLKTSSNILSPLEAKWCHRRRRLKTQKICMIISKFASMWRNKNFSFCERVHTVL